MPLDCLKPECTVAATGICFLNHPPESCPVRQGSDAPTDQSSVEPEDIEGDEADQQTDVQAVIVEDAVASLPERSTSHTQLKQGSALGAATLQALRRERRVHLISVLGLPNAGKTASIVSLYLLSAANKLDGFEFRNSESLMALQLLSQGARKWDPDQARRDQLTERTELQEPRRPSFIHLRLYQKKHEKTVDVALSDLPGEWTESLIDRSDADRLAFMKQADAIWIMIDGVQLACGTEGAALVNSTRILLSRIATLLPTRRGTPIVLVVSRRDVAGEPPADQIAKIEGEARKHKLEFSVAQIASFSEDLDNTIAGSGLADLLERSIVFSEAVEQVRASEPREAVREMMNYRTVT